MKKITLSLFLISAASILSISQASAQAGSPAAGQTQWQSLKDFTEQEYGYFKTKSEEIALLDKQLQSLDEDAKKLPGEQEKKQVWIQMSPVLSKKKEIMSEVAARDNESKKKLMEMLQASSQTGDQNGVNEAQGVGAEQGSSGPAESGDQKAPSMMQRLSQTMGGGAKLQGAQQPSSAQQRPTKDPQQIKAFQAEIQMQRQEFEKKLKEIPAGPKEQAQRDLNDQIKKETEDFQKDLKAMPPDPKEDMQKEFQERVAKDKKELDEKIKSMPLGPKEVKQQEFNKHIGELRKAFAEKIKSMPPDPRESAQKEFEASIQNKIKEFMNS